MPQFKFVVNGDYVEFYDGAQLVTRLRNSSQDVDWFYNDDSDDVAFEINGYKYKGLPSDIEINGVTLSAKTDFDAAIEGVFPGLTGGMVDGIEKVGDDIHYTTDGVHQFTGQRINATSTIEMQAGVQSILRMRSPNNSPFVVTVSDAGVLEVNPD